MDLASIIRDLLTTAQLMYLGTSHGGKPWVTPVYFAADVDMNIYWLSRKSRRHSIELSNNSHVAGSIVIPVNYGEKVRGLQFEGNARELSGQDADSGRNIYSSKFWIVEDRVASAVEGGDPQICYQLKPERYSLYDEVNYPSSPSQELKL